MNDFAEMFNMDLDMNAAIDDRDAYPGRNRIEMMANPAMWMTDTHFTDLQMITLRQICQNNIAYGGMRESCGVEEITEDLRRTTGNMNISLHTVMEMLCQMNSIVFRRAARSRHIRVYPAAEGRLSIMVQKFQKDHDAGMIPASLPALVLKAVWSVPPAEALIPMKYKLNAGPQINYDTRKDCPEETRRFPTRLLDEDQHDDMDTLDAAGGNNTDDAQTMEGWEDPQWDGQNNRWQTTIDKFEDFLKVQWTDHGPRYRLIIGLNLEQKIGKLFVHRNQAKAWKTLRGSLSDFVSTMRAEQVMDEFPGGVWSFAAYAKLWADAKEFEPFLLMTMEAEKRFYALKLLEEYDWCMNRDWSRQAWFRATVVGSCALTGEMQVIVIGAEIPKFVGDEYMISDEESNRFVQFGDQMVRDKQEICVPALMAEWMRTGNLFVHTTGVIPSGAVIRVQLTRLVSKDSNIGVTWEIANVGMPEKTIDGKIKMMRSYQVDIKTPEGQESIRRTLGEYTDRSRLPPSSVVARANIYRAQATFSGLIRLKATVVEKDLVWNKPTAEDLGLMMSTWTMDSIEGMTTHGVQNRNNFLNQVRNIVQTNDRLDGSILNCITVTEEERRLRMHDAWQARGLIDAVFNVCEASEEYRYVSRYHVRCDGNAEDRNLPRPEHQWVEETAENRVATGNQSNHQTWQGDWQGSWQNEWHSDRQQERGQAGKGTKGGATASSGKGSRL